MVEGYLVLAGSAELSANHLVSALGLNWSHVPSPAPPHVLLVFLRVPWTEAERFIAWRVELFDADGQSVARNGDGPALGREGLLTIGRPDDWPVGMALDHTQLCHVGAGLGLTGGEVYEWRLFVEDRHLASRSFYVRG